MILYLKCDIQDILRVKLPDGTMGCIISIPEADDSVAKLKTAGLVAWDESEGKAIPKEWPIAIFGHEGKEVVDVSPPKEEEPKPIEEPIIVPK